MKVLLATDGSEASHTAEWLLSRLPFPEPVDLTIAHVTLVPSMAHMRHEFPSSVNEMLEEYHARAESLLAEEVRRFEGMNGTIQTSSRSGNPASELVSLAKEIHSELVVLGARGLSPTKRLLLGSVSGHVARNAPCSVLVTRPSDSLAASDRPLRILCCLDGSPSSRRAAEVLSRFRWGKAVEICFLSIVTTLQEYGTKVYERTRPLRDKQKQLGREANDWAIRLMDKQAASVSSEIREAVHVADEIVNVITEQQADLVVLGHRGMNRLERFLLGSTSEAVLRHAPSSVWIIRDTDSD